MTYRGTGIAGQCRRDKIGESWVALPTELLESPAWRVLSMSARRLLDRIAIEIRHHGGHQGEIRGHRYGRYEGIGVIVTFDDFERYGIERHCIKPAICESEALGLLRITQKGRGGNAEFRRVQRYQLTYLNTIDVERTHDWRRFKTIDQAKSAKEAARAVAHKNKRPVRKSPPTSVRLSHTENGSSHRCGKPTPQGRGKNHTTSDISMGWAVGADRRPRDHRQYPRKETAAPAATAHQSRTKQTATTRSPLTIRSAINKREQMKPSRRLEATNGDRLATGRKRLQSRVPHLREI
jgi:hypothetical protein